tara:strand:+ start:231 stop:1397 length:1167 start_codon:yes stop_codon:yes gene_type:complete
VNLSSLHGRRIHIAGSIDVDLAIAATVEVELARDFVRQLVIELMKQGATFVVPVDAEKQRGEDNLPICFDWLIWETLAGNLPLRPSGAIDPLAVAVQHHKTEEQIPDDKTDLWDRFRGSDQISIDNASHWNMASKRMEIQAKHGEVLITIGGSEGVLYLANLYHQAGKPVIPLNFNVSASNTGARKLFDQALASTQAARFFSTQGAIKPHAWVNRLNFAARHKTEDRVESVLKLLKSLVPPTVFAVRLLNPDVAEYKDVEDYFTGVVQYVVEQEYGYVLRVVDGKQDNEESRVDKEIFTKLHNATVVVSDLTGERPNCFIEIGYALGRSIPTMMTAKEGTKLPFDVETYSGLIWKTSEPLDERRQKFREYWNANFNKPPLVQIEPLVP